jgi:hypothetical protein
MRHAIWQNEGNDTFIYSNWCFNWLLLKNHSVSEPVEMMVDIVTWKEIKFSWFTYIVNILIYLNSICCNYLSWGCGWVGVRVSGWVGGWVRVKKRHSPTHTPPTHNSYETGWVFSLEKTLANDCNYSQSVFHFIYRVTQKMCTSSTDAYVLIFHLYMTIINIAFYFLYSMTREK